MSDFSVFYNNVLNQSVEVSSKDVPFQCMDLAYLYIFTRDIPKTTIQHTYAREVYLNPNPNTKDYFDLIPNTPTGVPQTGDLVVFDKTVGFAGHICVATGEGDINYFRSIDQNWAGIKKCVPVKHNYNGVVGWLRKRN